MRTLLIVHAILATNLAQAGEVVFAPSAETCAPYIGSLVRSCPDIQHTIVLAPATHTNDSLIAALPQRHLFRARYRCVATPAAPTVKIIAPWGSIDLTGTSAGSELALEGFVPHAGGELTLTADISPQTAFGPNCRLEVMASTTLPLIGLLQVHLGRLNKDLGEAAEQIARFAEVVPTGGSADLIATLRQQLEADAAAKGAEAERVRQGTSPLIPPPGPYDEGDLAVETRAALIDELRFDQARLEGLSRRLGEFPADEPHFTEYVRAELVARHAAARERIVDAVRFLTGEAARLEATHQSLAAELRALATSIGGALP